MKKILLPIDIKSLHYGLKNDNVIGHTATVSTAIKQGNSLNTMLNQIFRIPKQIDFQKDPQIIVELMKNAKSKVKILNVFIFDKIKVNGREINNEDISFCMFVKEEVDPSKAQFGRVKLHYPTTLKLLGNDFEVQNKKILNLIHKSLSYYSFVCRRFEYDFETEFLDFIVDIVGPPDFLYSKVFLKGKGVGNKYSSEFRSASENYDHEIFPIRSLYGNDVGPKEFKDIYNIAYEKVIAMIENYLITIEATDIENIRDSYPYSIYDLSYRIEGKVYYSIVKFTYTNQIVYELTTSEFKFVLDFDNEANIILVTNVERSNDIYKLNVADIQKSSKSISKFSVFGG